MRPVMYQSPSVKTSQAKAEQKKIYDQFKVSISILTTHDGVSLMHEEITNSDLNNKHKEKLYNKLLLQDSHVNTLNGYMEIINNCTSKNELREVKNAPLALNFPQACANKFFSSINIRKDKLITDFKEFGTNNPAELKKYNELMNFLEVHQNNLDTNNSVDDFKNMWVSYFPTIAILPPIMQNKISQAQGKTVEIIAMYHIAVKMMEDTIELIKMQTNLSKLKTHVTHNAINCPFMSNQRSIRH